MPADRKKLKSQLPATMNSHEFQRFSDAIYEYTGIKMPLSKKIMLEGRLQKRLKALGLSTLEDYQ